ncbi:hypothetical protein RHMOL_Rhmol02G0068400 [Rhododendron molle]|uniref:Uncharacterized protein n=1 Tax=Rhododendron molle TaxID=49168 RepID=A0ACC0PM38_RHOML|nr:hypothetical protein RHMOL_Rhmol02G0068400 [Rhododendron molle]
MSSLKFERRKIGNKFERKDLMRKLEALCMLFLTLVLSSLALSQGQEECRRYMPLEEPCGDNPDTNCYLQMQKRETKERGTGRQNKDREEENERTPQVVKMSDHSDPSSETLDLDAIRSRITELREIYGSSNHVPEEMTPSDSEELLKDCALQLTSKLNQVLSEYSDVGALAVDDLDAYLGQLKEDLNSVEVQNAKISSEIEDLMETYVEDSHRLESELEGLYCSLDSIASQGIEKVKADGRVDCPAHGEGELSNAKEDCKFKMLELSHQIEKNKITLKSLQDLDCTLKRYEAVEKIEDALTGLKVMEFEGNRIRLTLRTYIPTSESLLSQHKIEDITEPLEHNHELVIEVLEGTLELKSVEIFPNDVYIGELIDATKSFCGGSNLALVSGLMLGATGDLSQPACSPLEAIHLHVQYF